MLKDEIRQHKKFVKEHTKNKELETKYHPISDRMSFWIDVYRGILAIQLTSAQLVDQKTIVRSRLWTIALFITSEEAVVTQYYYLSGLTFMEQIVNLYKATRFDAKNYLMGMMYIWLKRYFNIHAPVAVFTLFYEPFICFVFGERPLKLATGWSYWVFNFFPFYWPGRPLDNVEKCLQFN